MAKGAPVRPRLKLGIFMPCFNLDQYIDEALDSLYAQTSQDFHLIIADDCSTNSTAAKKLRSITLPRCEVYFEQKNLGLIPICNKYMSMFDTEYIMLFSPDDVMEPTFVEKSINYLDAYPEKSAVCTWISQFGDYTGTIAYHEEQCKLPEMLVENHYSGAAVVRKSCWVTAGKHDPNPDLFPNLDYDLWLCMLAHKMQLGVIHEPLFRWRALNSSLGHDVSIDRQHLFKKALLEKHRALYKQHSQYVISHLLDKVAKYEHDYLEYQDGHAWLDDQYRLLTKENHQLTRRLHDNITLPHTKYIKQIARKLLRKE